MEYKNSAGLFVSGVSLILAGPLVGFIAVAFGTRMAFDNGSTGLDVPFLIVAAFGGLLSIVGVISLVGATYRALVKIDAMS
jgi:hypothetical protein